MEQLHRIVRDVIAQAGLCGATLEYIWLHVGAELPRASSAFELSSGMKELLLGMLERDCEVDVYRYSGALPVPRNDRVDPDSKSPRDKVKLKAVEVAGLSGAPGVWWDNEEWSKEKFVSGDEVENSRYIFVASQRDRSHALRVVQLPMIQTPAHYAMAEEVLRSGRFGVYQYEAFRGLKHSRLQKLRKGLVVSVEPTWLMVNGKTQATNIIRMAWFNSPRDREYREGDFAVVATKLLSSGPMKRNALLDELACSKRSTGIGFIKSMIADGRVVEVDGMLRLASESDNTVPIGTVTEAVPITMHNGSRAQRSVSFQRYTVERVIDASPNPVTIVDILNEMGMPKKMFTEKIMPQFASFGLVKGATLEGKNKLITLKLLTGNDTRDRTSAVRTEIRELVSEFDSVKRERTELIYKHIREAGAATTVELHRLISEHDNSEHEVDRRSVNTLRDALCKQKIIKRVERQLDAAWSEEKVVLFCPKDEPADSPRITCKVLLTLRKRVDECGLSQLSTPTKDATYFVEPIFTRAKLLHQYLFQEFGANSFTYPEVVQHALIQLGTINLNDGAQTMLKKLIRRCKEDDIRVKDVEISKFWDRESKQPIVQVVKLLVMLNLVVYESDSSPQMRLATSLQLAKPAGEVWGDPPTMEKLSVDRNSVEQLWKALELNVLDWKRATEPDFRGATNALGADCPTIFLPSVPHALAFPRWGRTQAPSSKRVVIGDRVLSGYELIELAKANNMSVSTLLSREKPQMGRRERKRKRKGDKKERSSKRRKKASDSDVADADSSPADTPVKTEDAADVDAAGADHAAACSVRKGMGVRKRWNSAARKTLVEEFVKFLNSEEFQGSSRQSTAFGKIREATTGPLLTRTGKFIGQAIPQHSVVQCTRELQRQLRQRSIKQEIANRIKGCGSLPPLTVLPSTRNELESEYDVVFCADERRKDFDEDRLREEEERVPHARAAMDVVLISYNESSPSYSLVMANGARGKYDESVIDQCCRLLEDAGMLSGGSNKAERKIHPNLTDRYLKSSLKVLADEELDVSGPTTLDALKGEDEDVLNDRVALVALRPLGDPYREGTYMRASVDEVDLECLQTSENVTDTLDIPVAIDVEDNTSAVDWSSLLVETRPKAMDIELAGESQRVYNKIKAPGASGLCEAALSPAERQVAASLQQSHMVYRVLRHDVAAFVAWEYAEIWQLGISSLERQLPIVRPWLTLEGGLDIEFLEKLKLSLISFVFDHPGVIEENVCKHFSVFGRRAIQDVLDLLERHGIFDRESIGEHSALFLGSNAPL